MATDKIQEAARAYSEESRMGTIEELQEAAFIAGAIWQEQQGWVRVEDGLPENGKSVEVITEYLDRGKEASDHFIGYMDEDGDLIACPTEEEYGWQFNDCVKKWRYTTPPGSTPVESKEGKYRELLLGIKAKAENSIGCNPVLFDIIETINEALKD